MTLKEMPGKLSDITGQSQNLYYNNNSQFNSQQNLDAIISDLKVKLPSIFSCMELEKESENSFCGPCIKCDGVDRFVYKTDSGKCWCRQCHRNSMDLIDFHCWLSGNKLKDLIKQYLPEHRSGFQVPREEPTLAQNKNSAIQKMWDDISKKNTNEKPVFDLLCSNRKIVKETVNELFNAGKVIFLKHHGKISVAFPFTTLQGEVFAMQCLSVDEKPYPFTVNNGNPANKVFIKGSKPGEACFFQCGNSIDDASMIILTESVINAMTGFECFPDACCLALGASGFTDKIKTLKAYMDHVQKVVVCIDNDNPSEKMLRAIWDILGKKIFSFKWESNDPPGYDINDLLQAGQKERIIDLIKNAVPIRYQTKNANNKGGNQSNSGLSFTRLSDVQVKVPEWLIKSIIEKDSTHLFFGDPGCGKSFIGINIAACIASGTEFHGKKTYQGSVLYVAGEGKNGLKRRFTAWEIRNQISLSDANIFLSNQACSLCDASSIEPVKQAIDNIGIKPDLIIVDTVARNFGPGDENSTKDMSLFIDALDKIRTQYDCGIILIHHSGHGDKSRARGAMALKGALDSEFRMTKDDLNVVRVMSTKIKDFEPPEPMAFKIVPVDLSLFDEDGEPVTSAILDSIDFEATAIKASKAGQGQWQIVARTVLQELQSEHGKRLIASNYDPEQARVKVKDLQDQCNKKGMDRRAWFRLKNSKNSGIKFEDNYVFLK